MLSAICEHFSFRCGVFRCCEVCVQLQGPSELLTGSVAAREIVNDL